MKLHFCITLDHNTYYDILLYFEYSYNRYLQNIFAKVSLSKNALSTCNNSWLFTSFQAIVLNVTMRWLSIHNKEKRFHVLASNCRLNNV